MPTLDLKRWKAFKLVLIGASLCCAVACSREIEKSPGAAPSALAKRPKRKVVVSERAGQIRNYPCTDCHDKMALGTDAGFEGGAVKTSLRSGNRTRKHAHIRVKHYPGADNCFSCHNTSNFDGLRLINGESVPIGAAQKLCGQCHGEKLKDWKSGAHGKQVGGWLGVAAKYTCTHCHNPHSPAPEPVIAKPPPQFPVGGIKKGGH